MEPDFQTPAEQPIPPMEQPASGVNVQAPMAKPYDEKKDIKDNKDLAALSYLWIMGPVMFFMRKDSQFIHFHAKQGCVLFVMSVLAFILPFLGKPLHLIVVIGSVWGFLLAAHGLKQEVPFIGQISQGKLSARSSWKSVVSGAVEGSKYVKTMWHQDHSVKNQAKPQEQKVDTGFIDTFADVQPNVYYQGDSSESTDDSEGNNQAANETKSENPWQQSPQ